MSLSQEDPRYIDYSTYCTQIRLDIAAKAMGMTNEEFCEVIDQPEWDLMGWIKEANKTSNCVCLECNT